MDGLPQTPRARPTDGARRLAERDGRTIEYFVQGAADSDKPDIILIPSAGREASDFNELAKALIESGYKTIAIEQPGIGASTIPQRAINLYDLADDVVAVIHEDVDDGPSPCVIIGHAFGNRIARATATKYPDLVDRLILIAAGGQALIDEKADEALKRCFNTALPEEERSKDIQYAFFAEGNDVPGHWRHGWYGLTALMQDAASDATPDGWQKSGAAEMLIIQGAHDIQAPKEDCSDVLLARYPDRVEVAVIEGAGHALLPEQPKAIADAALKFLAM